MTEEPDYVQTSGREQLPLCDRIQLLENALLQEPFIGIDSSTRAITQAIHDLKITVAVIRSVVETYRAAVRRGMTDEELQRGARSMVAPYECWVLAWKRGGHQEWQRTRREQHRRRCL